MLIKLPSSQQCCGVGKEAKGKPKGADYGHTLPLLTCSPNTWYSEEMLPFPTFSGCQTIAFLFKKCILQHYKEKMKWRIMQVCLYSLLTLENNVLLTSRRGCYRMTAYPLFHFQGKPLSWIFTFAKHFFVTCSIFFFILLFIYIYDPRQFLHCVLWIWKGKDTFLMVLFIQLWLKN